MHCTKVSERKTEHGIRKIEHVCETVHRVGVLIRWNGIVEQWNEHVPVHDENGMYACVIRPELSLYGAVFVLNFFKRP